MFTPDAETHRSQLGLDTELVQQFDKIRVSPVVEDNESGVHQMSLAISFHKACVGMSSDVAVRFKDSNLCFFERRFAATNPEIPEPTTAMRIWPPLISYDEPTHLPRTLTSGGFIWF